MKYALMDQWGNFLSRTGEWRRAAEHAIKFSPERAIPQLRKYNRLGAACSLVQVAPASDRAPELQDPTNVVAI